MTRDDIAPLGDDEPFPCPTCKGSGLVWHWETELRRRHVTCSACGGSGYGPPPPEMDRLMAHCLARLAKWAQRNLPNEEQ